MKSVMRLVVFAFMIGGWAIAALCIHVVRTPNPADPQQSNLVVIPKERLGIHETYVDARTWKMSDVLDHRQLVLSMVYAGQARQLQFLAEPGSNADIATQLTDVLAGESAPAHQSAPPRSHSSSHTGKVDWANHRQEAVNRPAAPVAPETQTADADSGSLLNIHISY